MSEPKKWRDMTPEEKGALLLAHHEGKVIEYFSPSGEWRETFSGPDWIPCDAYRVKPTPREYVAWQVCWSDGEEYSIYTRQSKIAADKMAANLGGYVVKLTGTRDEG